MASRGQSCQRSSTNCWQKQNSDTAPPCGRKGKSQSKDGHCRNLRLFVLVLGHFASITRLFFIRIERKSFESLQEKSKDCIEFYNHLHSEPQIPTFGSTSKLSNLTAVLWSFHRRFLMSHSEPGVQNILFLKSWKWNFPVFGEWLKEIGVNLLRENLWL